MTHSKTCEQTLCRMPAFRPVAIQLHRLLADEDASVFDVVSLLNSDPAFSAEVLTVANSAELGRRYRIDTIERAVVVLGFERTKVIATRAALAGMLRETQGGPVVEACWAHSRATAFLAQWLAPFFRLHPDRAYTAGLLHDVGRIGLLGVHPQEYPQLLTRVVGTNADMLAAEQLAFRTDHCEAGRWLTMAWGLPHEFSDASSFHHNTGRIMTDPGAEAVRIACALAQALGYRAAPLIQFESFDDIIRDVPELTHPSSCHSMSSLVSSLEMEIPDVARTTVH